MRLVAGRLDYGLDVEYFATTYTDAKRFGVELGVLDKGCDFVEDGLYFKVGVTGDVGCKLTIGLEDCKLRDG